LGLFILRGFGIFRAMTNAHTYRDPACASRADWPAWSSAP
jgi:hypothetical protein